MTIGQELKLVITGNTSGAVYALAGVTKGLGSVTSNANLAAVAVGTLAAAFAIKIGRDAVQAAMRLQEVNASMMNQIHNAGGTWGQHQKRVDEVINSYSEWSGFTKTELTASLEKLVMGTKDIDKAIEAQAAAIELARDKHWDLAKTTDMTSKAYNGLAGLLRRSGIFIPTYTKGMEAVNMIQRQVVGSTDAWSNTLEGVNQRLGTAWNSILISAGQLLLPMLTMLGKALLYLMNTFNNQSEGLKKFELGIILIGGAITAGMFLFSKVVPVAVLVTKSLFGLATAYEGVGDTAVTTAVKTKASAASMAADAKIIAEAAATIAGANAVASGSGVGGALLDASGKPIARKVAKEATEDVVENVAGGAAGGAAATGAAKWLSIAKEWGLSAASWFLGMVKAGIANFGGIIQGATFVGAFLKFFLGNPTQTGEVSGDYYWNANKRSDTTSSAANGWDERFYAIDPMQRQIQSIEDSKRDADMWNAQKAVDRAPLNIKIAELNLKSAKRSLLEAERAANKELTDNRKQFNDQVADLQKQFREREKDAWDKYKQELKDRTNEIRSSTGLFDKPEDMPNVSANRLVNNLNSQVNRLKQWSEYLAKLKKRGISQEMMDEIVAKGPDAIGDVAALATADNAQLADYKKLYGNRTKAAAAQAKIDLEPMRKATIDEVAKLRVQMSNEYAKLAKTFRERQAEISASADPYAIERAKLGVEQAQNALDDSIKEKATAAKNLIDMEWADTAYRAQVAAEGIGGATWQGITTGLDFGKKTVKQQLHELIYGMVEEANDTLEIKSPSKVFWRIGYNITNALILGAKAGLVPTSPFSIGLAISNDMGAGIKKGVKNAVKEAKGLVKDIMKAIDKELFGDNASAGGTGGGTSSGGGSGGGGGGGGAGGGYGVGDSIIGDAMGNRVGDDLLKYVKEKVENMGIPKDGYQYISGVVGDAINYGMKFLGIPYKWGGATPSGFDCSGFTQYVARHGLGVSSFPRTAHAQYDWFNNHGRLFHTNDLGNLKRNDFVYLQSGGPSGWHTGIYAGGGKYLNSPSTGDHIKFGNLSASRIRGVGRLPMAAYGGVFNSPYIGGEAGEEWAIPVSPQYKSYGRALLPKAAASLGYNIGGVKNYIHIEATLASPTDNDRLIDDLIVKLKDKLTIENLAIGVP